MVFNLKLIQMLKTLMLYLPKTLQYRRKMCRSVAVLLISSRQNQSPFRYRIDLKRPTLTNE